MEYEEIENLLWERAYEHNGGYIKASLSHMLYDYNECCTLPKYILELLQLYRDKEDNTGYSKADYPTQVIAVIQIYNEHKEELDKFIGTNTST